MSNLLRITSIQSPNADATCRRIADYLGAQLGLKTEFVNRIPWQAREALLDTGDIQMGWICGLPYVWKADAEPTAVELLAAPVMAHPRYCQRPVYFSDVVVRRDSPFHTFDQLRGGVWAYNEPHSQSGYNVTRYHLATMGEREHFFGRVVEAGSHLQALEMVLNGRIDASAIDSTVLELELATRPWLRDALRIIDSLGPSPIPPWVVHQCVPPDLRDAIRRVLWQMHETAVGREILAEGQMLKLARVTDSDYDSIRSMESVARDVIW